MEDNLAALRVLETESQQENDAVADARRQVELFTYRYEGGADSYLQVVTARTMELANERNAIDLLRRRMEASVLLRQRGSPADGMHRSYRPSVRCAESGSR